MLLALGAIPAFLPGAGAHAFFGAGVTPVKLSGYQLVELSDWQDYGLGPAEGRLGLDLRHLNREWYAPAMNLGVVGQLDGRADLRLDVVLTVDQDLFLADVGLAVPWRLLESGPWTLSAVPRIGYVTGQAHLGTLRGVPGKSSTVILGPYTLRAGDKVGAELSAISLMGGLSLAWRWMDLIGLQFDLGYTYTDASAFELKINGLSLDRKHPSVTAPGGGSTSAGLHPHTQLNGAVALLSLVVWVP